MAVQEVGLDQGVRRTMADAQRNVIKVKLMGGEHTEGERETRPERGSAIKGNSVGGAFALPTASLYRSDNS